MSLNPSTVFLHSHKNKTSTVGVADGPTDVHLQNMRVQPAAANAVAPGRLRPSYFKVLKLHV